MTTNTAMYWHFALLVAEILSSALMGDMKTEQPTNALFPSTCSIEFVIYL